MKNKYKMIVAILLSGIAIITSMQQVGCRMRLQER